MVHRKMKNVKVFNDFLDVLMSKMACIFWFTGDVIKMIIITATNLCVRHCAKYFA